MFKKIARLFDRIIYRFNVTNKSRSWPSNNLVNVLIFVNKYYTQPLWMNNINQALDEEVVSKANWYYISNSLRNYHLIEKANIVFLTTLSKHVAAHVKNGQTLYIPFVGVDQQVLKTLPEDINLVHSPSTLSAQSISEYCIATTISFTRNLHLSSVYQKKKIWNQKPFLADEYFPISNSVVGVLGLGNIGSSVAKSFHSIGCKVIGCDAAERKDNSITKFYHIDNLSLFLKEIDILIITVSLNASTMNMITLKELRMLGHSGILVNVSRGAVVNVKDLIYALKSNIIRGAILDVFKEEPLPQKSPLYRMSNVVLTPHIAGNMNLFRNQIQLDFIKMLKSQIFEFDEMA